MMHNKIESMTIDERNTAWKTAHNAYESETAREELGVMFGINIKNMGQVFRIASAIRKYLPESFLRMEYISAEKKLQGYAR